MKQVKLPAGYKIAHRGLHGKQIPENSLASFEEAINRNIAIELDVHILKDQTVVVFHDDNLKRMVGIDKDIRECTYEELKAYKLKDSSFHIPTLKEVLKQIDGKVPLLIELKYDVKGGKLERAVAQLLKSYVGEYYIQSFWPFSIYWWKKHDPKTYRGLLIAVKNQSKLQLWLVEHFLFLLDVDFVSYEKGNYQRPFFRKCVRKGIPIFIWTVKTKQEYLQAKPFAKCLIVENLDELK